MSTRVKGQDVIIQVVRDNVPVAAIADIRNFELTVKLTKLEEQYLGEPSKRYDEIYDGVDFRFDIHLESADIWDFLKAVRDRSVGQTRQTATTINIQVSMAFPNGVRPRILLKDCFFENLPLEFGDRSQYGQLRLSGSCSDFERVS